MASDYRIYPQHDTLLASLVKFTPQCRTEGVKATRRDFLGGGGVVDRGLYVELVWDLLPLKLYAGAPAVVGPPPIAAIDGVLKTCGLDLVPYHEVTLYCRNDQYAYHRYNGIAIRPQPSWQNSFARNIVVLVRELELIA